MKPSSISRRSLMQSASLVPLAAVAGTPANSAVKVGLIGAGGRGTTLARYLVEGSGARLVAISDLFDERIERAKKRIPVENPKIYKNYHDLLASDVDAVIIATPVYLHPEHLEAAVRAKKHIYVEKPAAADIEGCKRVMRVSDSAGPNLNITFGFQQRYGPGYKTAWNAAHSEGFGPMRQATARFIKGAWSGQEPVHPKPITDIDKVKQWKHWRHLFGGIIVETHCHSIDVLNWFLGGHPMKAVGSGGRTIMKAGDMADHITVVFDYEDNVQATLIGSQITPSFYRDVHEKFFGANEVVETARHYWTHHRGQDNSVRVDAPHNITRDSVHQFVQRVREGKPENVGVRGAESTLTALMGRMAIDLRREVTWDEMMKS